GERQGVGNRHRARPRGHRRARPRPDTPAAEVRGVRPARAPGRYGGLHVHGPLPALRLVMSIRQSVPTPLYRERLRVPARWWALGTLLVGTFWLAMVVA